MPAECCYLVEFESEFLIYPGYYNRQNKYIIQILYIEDRSIRIYMNEILALDLFPSFVLLILISY